MRLWTKKFPTLGVLAQSIFIFTIVGHLNQCSRLTPSQLKLPLKQPNLPLPVSCTKIEYSWNEWVVNYSVTQGVMKTLVGRKFPNLILFNVLLLWSLSTPCCRIHAMDGGIMVANHGGWA